MRAAPIALAAVAAALAPAGARAGERHDPIAVVEHIFEVADADHSGGLSRAEYAAAGLARFGVGFDACDADGDGETSLSEYLDVYLRFHPSADRRKI
ncbi:MAG TPA: hypothetical protein VKB65_03105 [Myxococcota bacterium]|nr:hypothetical protein [Myxococcota bacterium]